MRELTLRQFLFLAPYLEQFWRCKVYVSFPDGDYRPEKGWPLRYA